MTAVLLGTAEVHSPEWHELRAGGIGGSEIAAVVGLSPYQSPFHLWHVKAGNIPGPKLSNAMDWGNRLEPVVIDWWHEQHPHDQLNKTPGTWAHSERLWQRCNPDTLILEDYGSPIVRSLLQVKTSRFGDGFGPTGSDQIPIHYRAQVTWEMDVFGVDHCWLAVLVGGNDPREYRIDYDAGDAKVLRDAAEAFWHSLQNDTEPPLDATDSTYEAVRKLHPDIDREAAVEIPDHFWGQYVTGVAAADKANEIVRGIKSKILAHAGAARTITHQGQPVLRRQMSSAGTPYLKEIA